MYIFKTAIGMLINYFGNNVFIMLSRVPPFPGSQGIPSLEARASLPWKPGHPFPGSQGIPSLEARASLPWKPGHPFPGSQGIPSLEARASLPWKPGHPFPARVKTLLSRTFMNEKDWFIIVQTLLKQQICFHKMSKVIYMSNLYSKLNIIYIYIYQFSHKASQTLSLCIQCVNSSKAASAATTSSFFCHQRDLQLTVTKRLYIPFP